MNATPIRSSPPSSGASANADPRSRPVWQVELGLGPLRMAWALAAAVACLSCTSVPAPERSLLAVWVLRGCLAWGRTGRLDGRRAFLWEAVPGQWHLGRQPAGRAASCWPWQVQRVVFLPLVGGWLQLRRGRRCRYAWVAAGTLDRRLRHRARAGTAARADTAGRSAAASIGRIGELHHENRA